MGRVTMRPPLSTLLKWCPHQVNMLLYVLSSNTQILNAS